LLGKPFGSELLARALLPVTNSFIVHLILSQWGVKQLVQVWSIGGDFGKRREKKWFMQLLDMSRH
jgi:hypothetical protein